MWVVVIGLLQGAGDPVGRRSRVLSSPPTVLDAFSRRISGKRVLPRDSGADQYGRTVTAVVAAAIFLVVRRVCPSPVVLFNSLSLKLSAAKRRLVFRCCPVITVTTRIRHCCLKPPTPWAIRCC